MGDARVERVHVKPNTPGEHGFPKRPVPEVRITTAGLEGDYNRWRQEKKAGDGRYAVLLLPTEILGELRTEGWPVALGDLGENLATVGLPNVEVGVGQRYLVGDEVLLEIAEPCEPCRNLAKLPYVGDARSAVFIKTLLGRRGWYARVLEEGTVRAGDSIRLRVQAS